MTCVCNIPEGGWCERHGCMKTKTWVRLCRTRPAYFQLWEEGRGPGQHNRPMGLGDMVAKGLEKVGITKERVSRVMRHPCGCCGRQERWNRFGRKIGIGVSEPR